MSMINSLKGAWRRHKFGILVAVVLAILVSQSPTFRELISLQSPLQIPHEMKKIKYCEPLRRTIPPACRYTPPLLWSFPLSGEGYLQSLLEYSTGFQIGRLRSPLSPLDFDMFRLHNANKQASAPDLAYPKTAADNEILGCNTSFVLLHADTLEIPFTKIVPFKQREVKGAVNKCLFRVFSRTLVIIRDPYDMIFAMLMKNRKKDLFDLYGLSDSGRSNGEIVKARENMVKFAVALGKKWQDHWANFLDFYDESPGNIMIVKYQDIKTPGVRIPTLKRIMNWITPPGDPLVISAACLDHINDPSPSYFFGSGETDTAPTLNEYRESFLKFMLDPMSDGISVALSHFLHATGIPDKIHPNTNIGCLLWSIFGREASISGFLILPGLSSSCSGLEPKSEKKHKALMKVLNAPLAYYERSSCVISPVDESQSSEPQQPPKFEVQVVEKKTCDELSLCRSFLPDSCQVTPPLFWSFPGSGNTFIRGVLESATSYYTGAVYLDKDIQQVMPGEGICDARVFIVKAHPSFTPYNLIANKNTQPWGKDPYFGDLPKDSLLYARLLNRKTKNPSIERHYKRRCGNTKFTRALVVVRNPFDAIWSEFQRLVGEKEAGSEELGHTSKITKEKFEEIKDEYIASAISLAYEWKYQFEEYRQFLEDHPNGIYMATFESLSSSKTQVETLFGILKWIGVPGKINPSLVECAFQGTIDKQFHRKGDADASKFVSKEDAYNVVLRDESDLACRMWRIFGQEAYQFGYRLPFKKSCALMEGDPRDNTYLEPAILSNIAQYLQQPPKEETTPNCFPREPALAPTIPPTPDDELLKSVFSVIDSRKANNLIVITFASFSYIESLMNWFVSMNRLGVTNYAVAALDDDMHLYLENHQLPTFRVPFSSNNIQELWIARIKLISGVLAHGVDVVQCDSDAIWIRDPMEYISKYKFLNPYKVAPDIIATRGSYPMELGSKWGATICMGWIYFRASESLVSFMRGDIQKFVVKYKDDQVAINIALDKARIRWERSHMTYIDGKSVDYGCASNINIRVALLPHTAFPRICDNLKLSGLGTNAKPTVIFPHSYVVHCYVAHKTGTAKFRSINEHGLWFLHDNWTSIQNVEGESFLDRIDKDSHVFDRIRNSAPPARSSSPYYLTFVVTSRNQNNDAVFWHQRQIDNIGRNADRLRLSIELLIVEWNPLPGRPMLQKVLKNIYLYLKLTFVTIPNEVHSQLVPEPSQSRVTFLRHHGYNVGIRHALGDLVACTLPYMIFDDEFFDYVATYPFYTGTFYRMDTFSIASKEALSLFDLKSKLNGLHKDPWVREHLAQAYTALGVMTFNTESERTRFWSSFDEAVSAAKPASFLSSYAKNCCQSKDKCYSAESVDLTNLKSCNYYSYEYNSGFGALAKDGSNARDVLLTPQLHHLTGPASFTMLWKSDWLVIRGYPELLFDNEVSKYVVVEATVAGLRQAILPYPHVSYRFTKHIIFDHQKSSIYSAKKFHTDSIGMIQSGVPTTWEKSNLCFNPASTWGLNQVKLEKTPVLAYFPKVETQHKAERYLAIAHIHDGLSGAVTALEELFGLAKASGRTLVEPHFASMSTSFGCIGAESCIIESGIMYSSTSQPMSELYDLETLSWLRDIKVQAMPNRWKPAETTGAFPSRVAASMWPYGNLGLVFDTSPQLKGLERKLFEMKAPWVQASACEYGWTNVTCVDVERPSRITGNDYAKYLQKLFNQFELASDIPLIVIFGYRGNSNYNADYGSDWPFSTRLVEKTQSVLSSWSFPMHSYMSFHWRSSKQWPASDPFNSECALAVVDMLEESMKNVPPYLFIAKDWGDTPQILESNVYAQQLVRFLERANKVGINVKTTRDLSEILDKDRTWTRAELDLLDQLMLIQSRGFILGNPADQFGPNEPKCECTCVQVTSSFSLLVRRKRIVFYPQYAINDINIARKVCCKTPIADGDGAKRISFVDFMAAHPEG